MEPSPPPERASWRTCLCDLQGWIDVIRFPGLIDLVCSLGLPVLIHLVLCPPPPPPAAPGSNSPMGTRRRGQAIYEALITPPLGLIDLVRCSPLPVARPPPPSRAAVGNVDDNERQPPPTVGSSQPLVWILRGQPLVEIFAVYANFPFVGTIFVCDGRWGKSTYWREDWAGAYRDFVSARKKWLSNHSRGHAAHSEFKDKLALTGPNRFISADGGFLIEVVIPATKKRHREICKLLWNWDDLSMYNKPKTCTIITSRGCVYVTCAVLSDAVEATVKVMLRLPWECAKVHGHISARINTFSIESTLFSKDVDKAVDVSISSYTLDSLPQGHSDLEFYPPVSLPLARSVLAVPIGACLEVKGELVFNGSHVISVNHSIPIQGESVKSEWVQDNYCFTTVRMEIRSPF
ncbi:uncharacterized protein LOC133904408 [Phragmites australis]|uniref:uncharacterized protein LOC133904408 n=1 Tax=Phragmites australis TaxID=29695 RepID=UPI002D79843A|nr:uncharacterized protein LOC133904408 [Phragmites australis]